MKPQKRQKAIQKKIKELIEKYEEIENLNKSAWKDHGRELCSAEILEKEEKILKEIEQLKELLKRPEIEMNDKLLKQKKKEILNKITAIEIRGQELFERKENIEKYLTFIKSILEIE